MAGAVVPPGDAPRKRLYRRSPGERWFFAVLLVPALLTAALVYLRGGAIEDELQQKATAALRSKGLEKTTASLSGRNVTLKVPTGESKKLAREAVATVEGIGGVDVVRVAANAAEARACASLQGRVATLADEGQLRFPGSSASLTSASAGVVHEIARLMIRCPSTNIVAEGYTDGSVLNGSNVSLRRADAVRSALVRDGVKASRIETRGFGDSYPVSTANTPEARAANNRVALTLEEGTD